MCKSREIDRFCYANPIIQLPPDDIGGGSTWTKDATVTWGGFHSFYKDYTSGSCPGRYRVRANTEWFGNTGGTGAFGSNEWPPTGVFDGLGADDDLLQGYSTGTTSCGSATDCDVRIVLQVPCPIYLYSYGVRSRESGGDPSIQAPTAAIVQGAADESSGWTTLGSYTGQTWTGNNEYKTFKADESLGPFTWFLIILNRVGGSSNPMQISDVYYFGRIALESFPLPPRDIGVGSSWAKDASTTYNGRHTFTKTHSSGICAGTYRVSTNVDWTNNSGSAGAIASNENLPAGAFDQIAYDTSDGTTGWVTIGGSCDSVSSGSDCDFHVILQLPCSVKLVSWGVRAAQGSSTYIDMAPGKAEISGSTDGSTWTSIGTFDSITSWIEGESRFFNGDTSLGPFSYFKFTAKRRSASTGIVGVADVLLYGQLDGTPGENVPPSSIGQCPSYGGAPWIQDGTWSNKPAWTASTTDGSCPGNYTAVTNSNFYINPVAAVFDGTTASLWFSNTVCGAALTGSDCNIQAGIHLPCSVFLSSFQYTPRGGCCWDRTPSKMLVEGSNDGSTWTEITSYVGMTQSTWPTDLTPLDFTGNLHVGPFSWIRFTAQRAAPPSSGGQIEGRDFIPKVIIASGAYADECTDATHDCDANAQCANTYGSFTCSCNVGYVSGTPPCSPTITPGASASVLPPTDIAAGSTWTEDSGTQHNGHNTFYTDYAGAFTACHGRYRAMSSSGWQTGYTPAEAFDGVTSGSGEGYRSTDNVNPRGGGALPDQYLILELPCSVEFAGWSGAGGSQTNEPAHYMKVHGSTDNTNWVEVGSFTGQWWTHGEVKTYSTSNCTAGFFNYFKFSIQRRTHHTAGLWMMADFSLFAAIYDLTPEAIVCDVTPGHNGTVHVLPPSDIGVGSTWSEDSATQYNGHNTFYTDYAGSFAACHGRYRAMSSSGWQTGYTPAEAFDGVTSGSGEGYRSTDNVNPRGGGALPDQYLILELPCSVEFAGWSGAGGSQTNEPAHYMKVHGSTDNTNWDEVGSFTGQWWTHGEVKTYSTSNCAAGSFSYFKFSIQRRTHHTAGLWMMADFSLYAAIFSLSPSGVVCTAASCDEANDSEPNTVGANVQRADSGQTGSTTDTATFTYTCASGYSLDSAAGVSFSCTGDSPGVSTWKGTPPSCSAVSCDEVNDPQPNTLSAEVIRSDSGQAGTTTQTATFTYSCNNGYQISGTANPTFTCTGTAYATSQWQGGTVPTCTAVSCDEVNDPQPNTLSTEVVRSDSGQAGTTTQTATFTYSCNNGYQISGTADPTFTCTGTGYGISAWQGGTVPTCTAVSCDEVNDPQPNTLSTEVVRSDSSQAGTTTQTATFTYSCNNGYQISGTANPTFTCTGTAYATSEWQGTVPTCAAVSCDEVNDPQPNTLSAEVVRSDSGQSGTTTQTATFTYSCNNGYELVGSGTPSFTCTGTSYASSAWQGGTVPTCAAVACDEVNDPQPNTLTAEVVRSDSGQSGTTTQTATFTYSCNSGYQLVGSGTPTFTCTGTAYATSEWQGGTVPTCTAAMCDEVNNPQPNTPGAHSVRSDSGGQAGTTGGSALFNYTCNTGYVFNVSSSIAFSCTGDALGTSSWKGTAPDCFNFDECTNQTHNCVPNYATCTDTDGSFECACNDGYQGNGVDVCGFTAGPVVKDICESDGSTPAAEVTSNYDTEMAAIQQWQTDNSGVSGSAELTAMDSEALAATGGAGGGASSGGDTSGGSDSSGGTTLGGSVVVTAPAAEKPSQEDREVATAAAVKILQAVDNIADNLAEAVPIGEVTIIKTETLSIAVQSSPPDARVVVAKSETASIELELADTNIIASIPQTGSYEDITRTIRQSMPSTARSDNSDKARSLTLMESVSNPAPFAGARTRENGFVTNGLSPFVRMAARQGGEVIGGSRTPMLSSGGSSSRAAGGRSSRRLDSSSSSSFSSPLDGVEKGEEISQRGLAEVTSIGKNVARVELSSPEQQNLLTQRDLIEAEWSAYRLGRTGGTWKVGCAQLDVQNEEWTHDGCIITGAEKGDITDEQIVCECEIRAMEAIFSISQRYVEPPAALPTAGTAQQNVLEDLPDVGFLFLLQTVALSSVCIFGALTVLIHTAYKAERKLLPLLPEVSPSLSICDWRRRQTKQPGRPKVSALKDLQSNRRRSTEAVSGGTEDLRRAGKYHSSQKSSGGKGKGTGRGRGKGVDGKKEETGSSQALQEITARAKALFASQEHVHRIRKFFNPRRIVAFHMSRGVSFDQTGSILSRPAQKRSASSSCSCRCTCLRFAFMRQMSLGTCDAPVIRRALKVRQAQFMEAQRGYATNQEERQKALWKEMEVEMAGRQYEMGFVFSTAEIKARVLRAMKESRKGKQKSQKGPSKKEETDSDSDSSSNFDSDSSGDSSSRNSSGSSKERKGEGHKGPGETVSESEELYHDLSALMDELHALEEDEKKSREGQLKEKMKNLKDKAALILGREKGTANQSTLPPPGESGGRGARGEVVLLFPSQSEDDRREVEEELSKRRGSVTDNTVRLVEDGGVNLSASGSFGQLTPFRSAAAAPEKEKEKRTECESESIESAKSQEDGESVQSIESAKSQKSESEESQSGESSEDESESSNSVDGRHAGDEKTEKQKEESIASISSVKSEDLGDEDEEIESISSGSIVEEHPTNVARVFSSEGERDGESRSPPLAVQREASDGSSLSIDPSSISSASEQQSIAESKDPTEEGTHAQTQSADMQSSPSEGKERESKKQPRRLKSTAAEVFRRLSACGLGAPAKRWRAPMSIVAPADASRDGTLPLRMNIKRNIIAVRVSRAKLVAEISNLSILTEALVFTCKMLLTLNGAFFLCLTTVITGETDDRHTNRRPVTMDNAPEGFGLEGYGDMEAFLNASALKALISYLSVELLFALLASPTLNAIWSAENSYGLIDPEVLIWKSQQSADGNIKGENEGQREKKEIQASQKNTEDAEKTEDHKEEEGQLVDLGAWGLHYFSFPSGLCRETAQAKVPRAESARLYVRARRQEVVAQYVLLGTAGFFLLLLLLLFTSVGLAGDVFPVRHKQFVLREYLLSSLLVFCFALGFPFLLGILQGLVVWMSLRTRLFDWLLNCCPSILMFPELTQFRHVSSGTDTVKSLDGTPTADWVVPRVASPTTT
uniref:Uncharacterized protein n=1 Tax=Chromera velia CCMP2878 TaxID=1169474 RepID=A0A0G4HCI3_9ALVE|eukprot:Cvel_6345.t1-p1 / transcript=Cvel_6345.t1 / gene=Cvel_6345 / organism=Chromera_velia_CCMP2878 / gene_product=E-selectin, putative / transcript_product=E-selectin, putative / location=Cvel_scaffold308:29977-55021(+) / protein_length=3138 / sequence_SO=supercontig / SO=protein_coding / is_pseudo=false